MLFIILGIIVVGVIAIIVFYKVNEKKKLIASIDSLYADIVSELGQYIEKWDEDKFISRAEKIQVIIEKKKYSFEDAIQFIKYKNKLLGLFYQNNLEVLEAIMTQCINEFNDTLGNGANYVITPKIDEYANTFKIKCKEYADKSVKYDSLIIKKFMEIYQDPVKYINNMNTAYIANEKAVCKDMFDNVDGKSLDDNQREAVVNDDLRQLVIAGAGSGKTLTMSAKVRYLVERKKINPKDILLISFTRKAAEEMGERIKRLGIDIESSTFHKYGLGVIRKVQLKTPDIAEDISEYIDKYLKEVIFNDDTFAKEFLVLLGTLMLPVSDANESIGDRIAAEQRQDLTTIKGMYEAYGNKRKIDSLSSEIDDLQNKIEPLREKLGPLHEKLQNLVGNSTTAGREDNKEADKEVSKHIEKTKSEVSDIEEDIAVLESQIYKLKSERLSIKNERMKSAEEVMLANMFFLDGVPYEYEKEYPYDIEDNYRKKYRPDFYLSESDLYWEHFGIDENGRAKQYSAVAEKQYIEGISWKRDLHLQNKTKLAETYSWQFRKNTIAKAVNNNYEKYGVRKHVVRYCDVIKEIIKGDSVGNIESFKTLLSTFISLFKSYGYGISMFNQLRDDIDNYKDDQLSQEALDRRKSRDKMFIAFAEGFYSFYNSKLIEEHKIDFNDMIIQATSLIEHGEYIPSYKYVIIDEYQDISMGRYLLARATLEKSRAKLFCVGDDWQSIYRFSGSEVDLLVNFEKYFGLYSEIFIDKTYRNSQELLDISGAFVMQNKYQTPKKLKSDKHIKDPLRKVWYTGRYSPILEDPKAEVDVSMAEAFKCAVDDIVVEYPAGSILVLGRNNGDIRELAEDTSLKITQIEGETHIIVNKYPDLDIRYLTVHKSKGLEADNVIILNMKNSRSGFPNQIVDDPVINLLRNNSETFPFAEERRLFYVAITRTRNRTYMLVPMSKSSRFLDDIRMLYMDMGKDDVADIYPGEVEEAINNSIDPEKIKPLTCPICKVGTLVKREGVEGKMFVSCSNFPACTYSANNLESVRKNNRCPVCDNFLTKRNGKNGEFLGCMSYPYCTYSSNLVIENMNADVVEQQQTKRVDNYANKIMYNHVNGKFTNPHVGWTIDEDLQLKEEFKAHKPISEIVYIHQRTNSAIIARLRKLGLMD